MLDRWARVTDLDRIGRSGARSTPEYKLAMVAAYDAATEPGAKGALLRREGLYHSHIIEWRKARDAGALNAPAAKPSGHRTRESEAEKENERLRARAEKAERELAKTEAALEIMGKAHALLELLSESADNDAPPRK